MNWYKTSQQRWMYEVERPDAQWGVEYPRMTEEEADKLRKEHPEWKIRKYMEEIGRREPEEPEPLPDDPIQAFIADVQRAGSKSPLSPKMTVLWGSVGFTIAPYTLAENGVMLSDMISYDPGQGIGSQALEFLKSKAREHRIDLYLYPKTIRDGDKFLDQKALESWYGKHGFTPQKNGVYKFTGAPLKMRGRMIQIPVDMGQ